MTVQKMKSFVQSLLFWRKKTDKTAPATEQERQQTWLNYNKASIGMYFISAIIFVGGVVMFAIQFKKDWFVAGRAVWVGTALGGAFRSLGDVCDRLAKRHKVQTYQPHQIAYHYTHARLLLKYDELIQMYAPHIIRNETEFLRVQEIIDILSTLPKPTKGQEEYLQTLLCLYRQYDEEHNPVTNVTA